jgi:hypothetical protein
MMGAPGVSKYPELIESFVALRTENPSLTIATYCKDNGIAYYEFCKQWALSPHYQPILAVDKRFAQEGDRAVDNILLPKADIAFLQVTKSICSPIRMALIRHLCAGPATVKDFVLGTTYAYSSAIHAIRHLETRGIVRVSGVKDSFNLYELSHPEAVNDLLAAIEKMATRE